MVQRARAAAPTFSGTFGSTNTKASFMTLPPAASLHELAPSFYSQWQSLNDWVARLERLWRPVPFMAPQPEGCRVRPELASWPEGSSDAACAKREDPLVGFAPEAGRVVPGGAGYGDR